MANESSAQYFDLGFFDGLEMGRGHGNLRIALNQCQRQVRIPMGRTAAGKQLLGALHADKDVYIQGVEVDVETQEATGTTTVDIGVEGVDDDGLGDAVDVSAAGRSKAGPTTTVGSNETYISGNTAGALLVDGYVVGTDTDGDFGLFVGKQYKLPAGTELNYTVPVGGWTEFVGTLIVTYFVDPDAL
jgi:hypothetical protein